MIRMFSSEKLKMVLKKIGGVKQKLLVRTGKPPVNI